jgi:hypothetical protein
MVPRDVQVVPFGEVSITQFQAVAFALRLYQKDNISGEAICGVLIQSPDPLNPIERIPVLTGEVNVITEF